MYLSISYDVTDLVPVPEGGQPVGDGVLGRLGVPLKLSLVPVGLLVSRGGNPLVWVHLHRVRRHFRTVHLINNYYLKDFF